MKNKCGIYKIENPIGQIYIGGAKISYKDIGSIKLLILNFKDC